MGKNVFGGTGARGLKRPKRSIHRKTLPVEISCTKCYAFDTEEVSGDYLSKGVQSCDNVNRVALLEILLNISDYSELICCLKFCADRLDRGEQSQEAFAAYLRQAHRKKT